MPEVVWTEDKRSRAIELITGYLEKHGIGESIMQSDDALIEAPALLARIVDNVLIEGEGIIYVDED